MPREVWIRYDKIFLLSRCGQVLEQAAQGRGEITILGALKMNVDVVFGNMFGGACGSPGLIIGLNDLRGFPKP